MMKLKHKGSYLFLGLVVLVGFQNCAKHLTSESSNSNGTSLSTSENTKSVRSRKLDPAVPFDSTQLCSDFRRYFDTTEENVAIPWAGSYLVKTGPETAIYYVDPPTPFYKNSSPKKLAEAQPSIDAEWKETFGVDYQKQLNPDGKCIQNQSNFCNAWNGFFEGELVPNGVAWGRLPYGAPPATSEQGKKGNLKLLNQLNSNERVALYLPPFVPNYTDPKTGQTLPYFLSPHFDPKVGSYPNSAANRGKLPGINYGLEMFGRIYQLDKWMDPDDFAKGIIIEPNPIVKRWEESYQGYSDPSKRNPFRCAVIKVNLERETSSLVAKLSQPRSVDTVIDLEWKNDPTNNLKKILVIPSGQISASYRLPPLNGGKGYNSIGLVLDLSSKELVFEDPLSRYPGKLSMDLNYTQGWGWIKL